MQYKKRDRRGGRFLVRNYDLFNKIIEINKFQEHNLWYHNIDNFNLEAISKSRFDNQMKFIEEKFVPLIKETDYLCDVGCASGRFTFEFAKYCNKVDAYDMSKKMIDTANNLAKENNISNINFYQGTCEDMKYQDQYDKIALMGVLTCIPEDENVEKIITSIFNALKPNGYLILKENLNETDDNYYFLGSIFKMLDYKMIARSKKKYLEFFKKIGFEVIEEKLFERVEYKHPYEVFYEYERKIELTSFGFILKKK